MENRSITTLSSDGATLAKVIATFCVVLTHSYKLFNFMAIEESRILFLRGFHAFAACGVCVFFLLSGYFLTLKGNWDYKRNLKKKYKSLVIPYILFILLYACISCIGSLVLPSFFDDFRAFTLYDWFMHLVGIPFVANPEYYGPLWFVRELIILNLFSVILIPIVKKIPGYILFPVMAVVYFLPISRMIRYSIPFFIAGMHCGEKKKIPVLKNMFLLVSLMIIGFIAPILIKGNLSQKISVLIMSVTIIQISGNIVEYGKLKEMAQSAIPYSFPIYLLHEYPMTTIMRLLALMHISLPCAVVAFFIAPFLIIFFCIIIIITWKHILTRTNSLFIGGRK